jgi:hypothetical protein
MSLHNSSILLEKNNASHQPTALLHWQISPKNKFMPANSNIQATDSEFTFKNHSKQPTSSSIPTRLIHRCRQSLIHNKSTTAKHNLA